MRIGLSTSVIQRGKTGVASYVFALLRSLLSGPERHEFVVFALEQDVPLFDFARGRCRLELVSEQFRPPWRDILWHQTVLPSLARRLGLDVLHVPSYRRLLWPRTCALVGTVHDLAPFRVPGKYDWKRMLYGRVVARRLAARQHQLIAISRSTAADIQSFWHLPADRLTVIHQGLDHQRFHPAAGKEARDLCQKRWRLAAPFFLYVARLEHPGKNHLRLIAAFERFKAQTGLRWQLVLAGSDWHGAELIHAAIRRSAFGADIRCLGFVPDDDLPALYRAAEAFVYPSLFEGFGFPPLEAMACGCPVLCSRRGALDEVVGEAADELPPEDETGMARQLCALAADPTRRSRLQAAGLARARCFDWAKTAEETLKVYARARASLCRANPDILAHSTAAASWPRRQARRVRNGG